MMSEFGLGAILRENVRPLFCRTPHTHEKCVFVLSPGHQVKETHHASHHVHGWHDQNGADGLGHDGQGALQRLVWEDQPARQIWIFSLHCTVWQGEFGGVVSLTRHHLRRANHRRPACKLILKFNVHTLHHYCTVIVPDLLLLPCVTVNTSLYILQPSKSLNSYGSHLCIITVYNLLYSVFTYANII